MLICLGMLWQFSDGGGSLIMFRGDLVVFSG